MCNRPTCRFVHLMEGDKVEVFDQRVSVCRDHAKGACRRQQCKYYHIPVVIPPANVMATIHKSTDRVDLIHKSSSSNTSNNNNNNNHPNNNNNNNSTTTA